MYAGISIQLHNSLYYFLYRNSCVHPLLFGAQIFKTEKTEKTEIRKKIGQNRRNCASLYTTIETKLMIAFNQGKINAMLSK